MGSEPREERLNFQIPKVSSGNRELDSILDGGFPENRVTMIKGQAGTGKTTIGLECMCDLARKGAPVILVAFEEQGDVVRDNAAAIGLDIRSLEAQGLFFIWDVRLDYDAMAAGAFSIDAMLAAVKGKAGQLGARYIMLDGIDAIMRFFSHPEKLRNELYRLHVWLHEQRFTCLMTQKVFSGADQERGFDLLDYMVDCILMLDQRILDQVTTRRMRVAKYRGSGYSAHEHPFLITGQGLHLLPLSQICLDSLPDGRPGSTGIAHLDTILGGGLTRGTTVVSGPSGIGKTSFAATFARSACLEGQRVLYASYEDAPGAVIESMKSPGISLAPLVAEEMLHFYAALPETMGSEKHLYRLIREIDRLKPDMLVLDAISTCWRMGSHNAALDFIVRLVYLAKQRGISCVFTNQTRENLPDGAAVVPVIASIVDTHICMGYQEGQMAVSRSLVVVKSRGRNHSIRRHRFRITDQGIRISYEQESQSQGGQ